MSELDLTEAVEAAKQTDMYQSVARSDITRSMEKFAHVLVEAAAPVIERQVRERVVEDISAALGALSPEVTSNQRQGFYRSMTIARGER